MQRTREIASERGGDACAKLGVVGCHCWFGVGAVFFCVFLGSCCGWGVVFFFFFFFALWRNCAPFFSL